jgi:hypothetical protein
MFGGLEPPTRAPLSSLLQGRFHWVRKPAWQELIFKGKKLGLAQKISPQSKSYCSDDAFTRSIRS